jgi:hypothetical protein
MQVKSEYLLCFMDIHYIYRANMAYVKTFPITVKHVKRLGYIKLCWWASDLEFLKFYVDFICDRI